MTETVLTIRPEGIDDLDLLAHIYRSTREDLLQAGLPDNMLQPLLAMQFQAQQASYRQHYPDADFAIIEQSGQAVGSLITQDGSDSIRLIYIALLPQERNRGIGRQLIKRLQEEAAAKGKPLSLSVSIQNSRAEKLYAALGFCVAGEDGAHRQMIWRAQATLD